MIGKAGVKNLWRAETGIFFVLWGYLLWLGHDQFLLDPGVFWNTVIGQHVLDTGAVPRAEEFSGTLRGQPWNSHQWLAQCAMALLHRIGGLDSLLLATATLLAALYTWVAHRLISGGWHWVVGLLVAILTLLASRYHLNARPHLATIVLLGFTFARLVDYEAGRIPLRGLVWLPLVFVLWTNLHGGALGGEATVALVILGWVLFWLLGLPSPIGGVRHAAALVALLAACAAATFVNPYGRQLPMDWVRLMGSPVLPKYIFEHMPLDITNQYQIPIVLFGALYLTVFVIVVRYVGLRQVRVTWLIPLVWLYLTFGRARHCTLFSITAAIAVAELLGQTPWAELAQENTSGLFTPPSQEGQARETSGVVQYLIPVLVVLAAFALQGAGVPLPLIGKDVVRDMKLWPIALVPQLQKYEREHPDAAIFNDMAYGGLLIYYTPHLRIFIDDRCELYGDAFLEDYFQTNKALLDAEKAGSPARMDDPIERWQEKYRINMNLALVIKGSGFQQYLEQATDRWEKIGDTSKPGLQDSAILYQRLPAAEVAPSPRLHPDSD